VTLHYNFVLCQGGQGHYPPLVDLCFQGTNVNVAPVNVACFLGLAKYASMWCRFLITIRSFVVDVFDGLLWWLGWAIRSSSDSNKDWWWSNKSWLHRSAEEFLWRLLFSIYKKVGWNFTPWLLAHFIFTNDLRCKSVPPSKEASSMLFLRLDWWTTNMWH